MLKLKFDAKLDFQIESINSVIDLFKGQTRQAQNLTFAIVPNLLDLSKEKIFENLSEVQKRNGLSLSNIEGLPVCRANGTGRQEPYNFKEGNKCSRQI